MRWFHSMEMPALNFIAETRNINGLSLEAHGLWVHQRRSSAGPLANGRWSGTKGKHGEMETLYISRLHV